MFARCSLIFFLFSDIFRASSVSPLKHLRKKRSIYGQLFRLLVVGRGGSRNKVKGNGAVRYLAMKKHLCVRAEISVWPFERFVVSQIEI